MQKADNAIMTALPLDASHIGASATLKVLSSNASDSVAHSDYSRYAARVRRRYADQLCLLHQGLPTQRSLDGCFGALLQEHDFGASLRITRALAMERLIHLDCDGLASLEQVTGAMTALAEWSLAHAVKHVADSLQGTHGAPQSMDGKESELWIVGMGKLGARELNVSSDIDLIFVYSQEGMTTGVGEQGRGVLSNLEYFHKFVRAVCQLLSDVTEHGFVFRIDLALRPHGNSGPSAVSLAALEEYLLISVGNGSALHG